MNGVRGPAGDYWYLDLFNVLLCPYLCLTLTFKPHISGADEEGEEEEKEENERC